MDGFWHVDGQDLSSGMCRGQWVTGNVVGLRTKIGISGIGQPTLLVRMCVDPLLDVRQLLRPIHTGVAQIFVGDCRPAPGFVAIRHLGREYRHGRDDVESDQYSTDPDPAPVMSRERCQACCAQQRGQWIQKQNMTSADVHTAEDRHSQIDSAGHNQVCQFSSLPEPSADQRNTGKEHKADQAQRGLDGQRDGKVPPDTVGIVMAQEEDGILLRRIVNVSHPHQVGLWQQAPSGRDAPSPNYSSPVRGAAYSLRAGFKTSPAGLAA